MKRRRWPTLAGFLFVLLYLYAIDDISVSSHSDWHIWLGDIPLSQALQARSLLLFEGIGTVQAGPLIWLVSPVNAMIAGVLGALVALNLHGAAWLRRRPQTCNTGRTGGGRTAAAAMPALLAGGACCAPSLLLLLGIPGLGAFAALFAWLLPVSAAILVANRIWQRRQGAPPIRLRSFPD